MTDFEYLYNEDIPKYKSKKKKFVKKSNHKHDFENVILKYENQFAKGRFLYALGKICKICNKKKLIRFGFSKKMENGYYLDISNNLESILQEYPQYKDCRIIFVNDLFEYR